MNEQTANTNSGPVNAVVSGLTFGSLFAGIGGFDLGFERAGLNCKWQVEIDDYATRVLEKHWPVVHRERDIRECGRHNLERVDVICGGDPCQENSRARQTDYTKHKSLGCQFIRIVDELRPIIVLRENPPARKDAPWPWQRFRHELEQIGYAVLPFRLRACCFGFDHKRERVFLLATLAHTISVGCKEPWRQERGSNEAKNCQQEDHYAFDAGRRPVRPGVCRGAYGVSARMDRLRGLGNAVVPQIAEWIGRKIVAAVEAH